ncbi:MAG: prepilin-type N-terminal cleavage/methylation domain-containing protein [Betaproteobacteria bacterium]|nr:prepilin-type N-terminal cleavage/methylation domain-containing protein [Betaproteobacteria bacterium]
MNLVLLSSFPRSAVRRPLPCASPKRSFRQGFSIIELMISILIGMIVVLIIMQLFSQTEQWNRNATAGGDTQSTAQIAAYTLTHSLAEAGGSVLAARARTDADSATIASSDRVEILSSAGAATTPLFLPTLPVRISTNPNGSNLGDSIEVLTQSGVFGNGGQALWRAVDSTNPSFLVRSFQGIEPGPAAAATTGSKSWLLVSRAGNTYTDGSNTYHGALVEMASGNNAINQDSVTKLFNVQYAATLPDNLISGLGSDAVLSTTAPSPGATTPSDTPSAHWILGMGILAYERIQVGQSNSNGDTGLTRERREISDAGYPTLARKSFDTPYVVFLKAYYGFDNGDPAGSASAGRVTHWLGADACTVPRAADPGWTCTGIDSTRLPAAQRLVAVRFGIVVRSPQHDKTIKRDSAETVTLWKWNCGANLNCPAADPTYTVAAGDDYRYYTLQTTVPLRSAIWNIAADASTPAPTP